MNPDSRDNTALFNQLIIWRASGFIPELHASRDGSWVLLLQTDHWTRRGQIDECCPHEALSYVTKPCDSPQEAIRAAMEVIK